MCGITGIFDNNNPIQREVLVSMNDALSTRGPDDQGIYLEAGIGLGHRRLSIIDLSTGQQPMISEDGQVVVIYNGEIYNYRALRESLIAKGCNFQTQSDTEVLIHGYRVWGQALCQYLRGMFAFAIWDKSQQKLMLARDRLGIKPLYYARLPNGALIFGSELKALKQHPDFKPEIDPCAVADYFCYGYVPEPRSIYEGCYKLKPGHQLMVSHQSNSLVSQPYWDVPPLQPTEKKDWEGPLTEAIYDSVACRLVAEVPLGAFLSGGVDSSVVVCEMARASVSPVKTLSVGFHDNAFDESRYASQVAKSLQTDHSLSLVDGHQVPSFARLMNIYDEPFADSSAIPTLEVCENARKHVTVALSGDGGDEVFAGYRRYRGHLLEEQLRSKLPLMLRKGIFKPLAMWYPRFQSGPRFIRAKATFESLCFDTIEGYFYNISIFKPHFYQRLFSKAFKQSLQGYHPIEVLRGHASQYQGDCPLNLVQYLDLKTYLPGDILTKVDRASMHHSLEVRVPLLDHHLIGLAQKIPSNLKLHGQEGKYILKKTYEKRLAKEILYRRKQGFAVPLGEWFRGPLKPRALNLLSSQALLESGIFDPPTLLHLVQEHMDQKRDHSAMLWTLCMFEQFMRQQLLIDHEEDLNARIACA